MCFNYIRFGTLYVSLIVAEVTCSSHTGSVPLLHSSCNITVLVREHPRAITSEPEEEPISIILESKEKTVF